VISLLSRAIITNDTRARRRDVKAALSAVDETLRQPGLGEEEREAICAGYARCELSGAAHAPKLGWGNQETFNDKHECPTGK
jgi:hypothetical protein